MNASNEVFSPPTIRQSDRVYFSHLGNWPLLCHAMSIPLLTERSPNRGRCLHSLKSSDENQPPKPETIVSMLKRHW